MSHELSITVKYKKGAEELKPAKLKAAVKAAVQEAVGEEATVKVALVEAEAAE